MSKEQTKKSIREDLQLSREYLDEIQKAETIEHKGILYEVVLPYAKFDRMWAKFGIEVEDYNLAVDKYRLCEDDEVQKW